MENNKIKKNGFVQRYYTIFLRDCGNFFEKLDIEKIMGYNIVKKYYKLMLKK